MNTMSATIFQDVKPITVASHLLYQSCNLIKSSWLVVFVKFLCLSDWVHLAQLSASRIWVNSTRGLGKQTKWRGTKRHFGLYLIHVTKHNNQ